MKKKITVWQLSEWCLAILALVYFLGYPRAAASDFVVCTFLCILVYLGNAQLGLNKPQLSAWGQADSFLLVLTFLLFIAAWIYGFVQGNLTLSSALASLAISSLYFYYATIQHFLAQRYLALRMLNISNNHKGLAAILTGIVFGILHIPFPHLILPSTVGGMLFAYYYLSTGRLWMVIFAHALISSTLIYWFFGKNPFTSILELFT